MLRLKLDRFDSKTDERGYQQEANRQEVFTVTVEDSSEGHKLLAILETVLRGSVTQDSAATGAAE